MKFTAFGIRNGLLSYFNCLCRIGGQIMFLTVTVWDKGAVGVYAGEVLPGG